LAKPNYQFEKRQKDLAKKKKQEEKRQKKLAARVSPENAIDTKDVAIPDAVPSIADDPPAGS
jgi:hypothetical protein